ncbi:MAG: adenylate/guanylate cyclase domain-containing protein, partial [Desulfobacteraceae bacterium]|nr:adenylate/guanylate cyclase domain-containing protein [Desulfobacteraceae bacterium]
LIEEMHKNRTFPSLGGEAKVVTAFFTDIQSFSTFSEKLTAVQLVELLNEYLTAMTDILIEESGTLDKYEGDAIIAFFGAPMDLPDHEFRACRVAVKMQKRLGELREKWKEEKVPEGAANPNRRNVPIEQWELGGRWPRIVHNMRMRIGINTGEIVVGNMGSSMRMNYTMMGDPVNLAARLESAAKQYGVYTLISEYTLDVEFLDDDGESRRVMDLVEVRYLDRITVVGRSEPVRIYELFGMKGDPSEEEYELLRIFDEGMQHYLRMEWEPALERFSEAYSLERYPYEMTTPSEVFIQRCRTFRNEPPVPPGETWDGVYRLKEK